MITVRGQTTIGPSMLTNGLILLLDANSNKSYPGYGTTWYDLSGNNANGTINGATYNSSLKCFEFDGVTNGVDGVNVPQNYTDLMLVMNSGGANPGATGLEMVFSKYNDYDKSFRTASGVVRHSGMDANDWNYGSASYDFINGTFISGDVNISNTWIIVRLVNTNSTFTPPFVYSLSSDFMSRAYKGKISYVICYNRILSNSEVLQNYNTLKQKFGI